MTSITRTLQNSETGGWFWGTGRVEAGKGEGRGVVMINYII